MSARNSSAMTGTDELKRFPVHIAFAKDECCGVSIRKWSFEPFEGSTAYHAMTAPLPDDVERVVAAFKKLRMDHLPTFEELAEAAIATLEIHQLPDQAASA